MRVNIDRSPDVGTEQESQGCRDASSVVGITATTRTAAGQFPVPPLDGGSARATVSIGRQMSAAGGRRRAVVARASAAAITAAIRSSPTWCK